MRKYVCLIIFIVCCNAASAKTKASYHIQHSDNKPSALKTITLDLLIPGYGSFVHDNFWWGFSYASAKVLGGAFIFLSVRNYSYWRSVSDAANRFSRKEPGLILFKNPQNPSKSFTRQEIQNKADQAHLFFVFSIVLESIIYVVSGYHTIQMFDNSKKSWHPYYDFKSTTLENKYQGGLSYRF